MAFGPSRLNIRRLPTDESDRVIAHSPAFAVGREGPPGRAAPNPQAAHRILCGARRRGLAAGLAGRHERRAVAVADGSGLACTVPPSRPARLPRHSGFLRETVDRCGSFALGTGDVRSDHERAAEVGATKLLNAHVLRFAKVRSSRAGPR